MEIYNAVIGEPERVKDDYYYRSRKAVLMHEMYQRFGQLIRACRQRRGEERFETQPGTNEQRSLVKECLRLFTPWDTQCSVPRDFDPLKSVITGLTSKNGADENEMEVNRIHAVLHPDCFERLVAAFGYSPPAERMELPRFFMDQSDDQSPPRQRSAPAELSAEELAEINHMLDEQAGRRRRSSSTGVMRIIVDGVERARFNPAEQSGISFTAEEDAEIIEVRTTDPQGDLLLATHLLTAVAKVTSIRLEGGQDLSLSITRRQIETSGATELLVKFGYRETDPRRAARLWWQRFNLDSHSTWISVRYVLAGSIVIICLASFLAYVKLRSRQTNAPAQTSVVQTTPIGTEAPTPVNNKINEPENVATKATPRRVKRERSSVAEVPSSPPVPNEDVSAEAMRSGNVVPNLRLSEVKKVYVEIRGGEQFGELRSNLIENLRSSGVVAAAENADDADAALKITISQIGSQIEVSALLVNARGTVLWPRTGGARRYTGEIPKVASEVVKDLLYAIKH